MGKTSIEWTDASWNPIVGCTEISPGCANCYAARLAATRLKNHPDYKGLADIDPLYHATPKKPHWTGAVRFLPERLKEPIHWKKPRRIFVCDMGDLFHETVDDDFIEEVFFTIAKCQQHTFQILTKRADRMHRWISKEFTSRRIGDHIYDAPLPNVWLGVSVENQHFADERIPLLLAAPAAVRWISAEPLLGPVDLREHFRPINRPEHLGIDWIVCGGESGPNARPMHPEWARSLRDQCQAAGVPFFFKQWGEWGIGSGRTPGTPGTFYILGNDNLPISVPVDTYPRHFDSFGSCVLEKLGKKNAGRLLDGHEWNEFPSPVQVTP